MKRTMKRESIRVAASVIALLTIAAAITYAEVGYPSGTQDFESMNIGDDVTTLGWEVVNTSAPLNLFTVQGSDQIGGLPGMHGASTRWLKIVDTDGANVQNRFYSPPVNGPDVTIYEWVYYVNLETTPPGAGAVKPKFTIQHFDNNAAAFGNVWGIEFTDVGANLIVLGNGGPAASAPFYPLSGATAVGQWVKISLKVDFSLDTVRARANDGPPVTLPINLAANADPLLFRFCYRGEGTGIVMTMLLDDVSVNVTPLSPLVPTVSEWGLVVLTLIGMTTGTLVFVRRRPVASA
jgi:hypothetical protein